MLLIDLNALANAQQEICKIKLETEPILGVGT